MSYTAKSSLLLSLSRVNLINYFRAFTESGSQDVNMAVLPRRASPVTHFQPIKDRKGYLVGCGYPLPNSMAKVVDMETGKPLVYNYRQAEGAH